MNKIQINVIFLCSEKVHPIELNKGVLDNILCFSYVVIDLRLLSHSIDKHRFERTSNSQLWDLVILFTFLGFLEIPKNGFVGFSLNKDSDKHWLLNAHERASISLKCRHLVGMVNLETSAQKELRQTRMKRDETDVLKLCQTLQSWSNPNI